MLERPGRLRSAVRLRGWTPVPESRQPARRPGDEPGRLVEDATGLVHVALRRGGAIVSLDPKTGVLGARRAVCSAPRGIAFEVGAGLLHVACAGGELVSLPAAGGDPTRTLTL